MTSKEYQEVMTTDEAADFLRVHRRKLIELVSAGHIPAVRIGDGPKAPYRFSKSDVLAALTRLAKEQQAERERKAK